MTSGFGKGLMELSEGTKKNQAKTYRRNQKFSKLFHKSLQQTVSLYNFFDCHKKFPLSGDLQHKMPPGMWECNNKLFVILKTLKFISSVPLFEYSSF
jgi:hypothetical protein